MTHQFETLEDKYPVFRELRNLMDLSVVAALIAKEGLLERAQVEIPLIVDETQLQLPRYHTPQAVPTQCSFIKLTGSWLVTASGGVQVDSWSVVANKTIAPELHEVRTQAFANDGQGSWWWN
jgi:hypothetical protein